MNKLAPDLFNAYFPPTEHSKGRTVTVRKRLETAEREYVRH